MGTKSKKKTVNPDYLEIEHLLTIARRTSGVGSINFDRLATIEWQAFD